jgi:diacylglycerol kinase family enzyme
MFQKQVVPLLQDAAGFTLTQLVTERPGHATALAAGLDPTTTDLVLVVGGDGTVWEVLQVRAEVEGGGGGAGGGRGGRGTSGGCFGC